MVRLWTSDHRLIGTTELRHGRFVMRSIRHEGIPYELIGTGEDGVRDYRALEAIPLVRPRVVTVVNVAGSDLGTVAVDGPLPAAVTYQGVTCPLWTVKDQAGRAVYLKPEIRVMRGPKGRFQRVGA